MNKAKNTHLLLSALICVTGLSMPAEGHQPSPQSTVRHKIPEKNYTESVDVEDDLEILSSFKEEESLAMDVEDEIAESEEQESAKWEELLSEEEMDHYESFNAEDTFFPQKKGKSKATSTPTPKKREDISLKKPSSRKKAQKEQRPVISKKNPSTTRKNSSRTLIKKETPHSLPDKNNKGYEERKKRMVSKEKQVVQPRRNRSRPSQSTSIEAQK